MKWVEACVQVQNACIFTRLVSRDLVRWRLLTCFFPFFPDLWIHHPCPCCTYLAEEQKVTAWHLCACDIIRMLIWQYTNYDSWQSDTGKHFALPVEVTWPFSRTSRRLRICPTPPRCLLSPFFFPLPSPPSLAKSRLVDVRLSRNRRCYLLLTWQGHEFWSKVKLILLSKA